MYRIRQLAALLVIACLSTACLASAAIAPAIASTGSGAGQSQAELLQWIDSYRLKPDVKDVPRAVKAMSGLGLFTGQDKAAFFIGFLAGVLGDNPKTARRHIRKLLPLPANEQAVIIKAIAFSGLPDWREILGELQPQFEARRVLLVKYLAGDALPLQQLTLDAEPNLLDTLWGYYYATGRFEPVIQIISSLDWVAREDEPDKLTIGSMVKWTLAANAGRNDELLKLYRMQVAHQPLTVAAELQDVIDAVEDFDPDRIRREETKKLDEIARRPPKSNEDGSWSRWAAKAGSTVISLGCVVASAAGQAEIAAPCIVAGALYSAGSNLYFDSPWDATK